MALDLLSAAKDLIAIDSRSSVSTGEVVAFLSPLCRDAGLEVRVQREVRGGVEQLNLLAARPAQDGGALLLATHLDTVPPGDVSLWKVSGGKPFDLTEHDGELFGLGAADVKLDFLCKLAALGRLHGEDLRRPIVLAGTYGEEVGRYGAQLLVRELAPLPAMALVGEPTELQACPSHKGYIEVHVQGAGTVAAACDPSSLWRLRFTGVPAHSSQPDRGVSACDLLLDALPDLRREGVTAVVAAHGGEVMNLVAPLAEAIVEAPSRPHAIGAAVERAVAAEAGSAPAWSPPLTDVLTRLHSATSIFRRELAEFTDDVFRPPCSTVNNGKLRLTAEGLTYACDARLLPGDGPQRALDAYLSALEAIRVAGVTVHVQTRFAAPPFAARRDSDLLPALRETLAALGLPATDEIKSGTTEATAYARAGIDTVVFGPGVATGNIHKPDEHVPVAHLKAAADVYEGVIRRLCL